MLINAAQPHVLILGVHSKRGWHNFNFDRYTVHLKYQMNTEGITIELYPPLKKKEIDCTNFVSPYENPSALMAHKKSRGKTAETKNVQKLRKESTNQVEKLQLNKKGEKRRSTALKKCAIQRVFNFSETPNVVTNTFPYEGDRPSNTNAQKIMIKGGKPLKGEYHNAGLPVKPITAGCNLRDTLSRPQVRPKQCYLPLHKNYSMTSVQMLYKIKREQFKLLDECTHK